MRRLPLSFIPIVALAVLLGGCTETEKPAAPQVIYAGLGISNRLEVGMTLRQIGKKNPDLRVRRVWKPDTWPWEKILGKPRYFEGTIPSVSATMWGTDEKQSFGEVRFQCLDLKPVVLRAGTNEISLSAERLLSRDEVVRQFGQPRFNSKDFPPNQLPQLINAGQSVLWSNNQHAMFYYPAAGMFFTFQDEKLVNFAIMRKFADTNAVAGSK